MELYALIIGYTVMIVGGAALAGVILLAAVEKIIKVIWTSSLFIEFLNWKWKKTKQNKENNQCQ